MSYSRSSIKLSFIVMLFSAASVVASVEISVDSIEINESGGSFVVSAIVDEPTDVGVYGINMQFGSFGPAIDNVVYDAKNLLEGMSELGTNFGTSAHPATLNSGDIVRYVALSNGSTVISGSQALMQVDFSLEPGFPPGDLFDVSFLALEDQPTVRVIVGDGPVILPPTITITSDQLPFEPCDLNLDGVCNAGDIDLLSTEIRGGSPDVQRFDLNDDSVVDNSDRLVWIGDLMNTFVGDADLDGEFDSGDFVQVFTSNQYEDGIAGNSTWATGDWNGDADFDSGDFVAAFTEGGYEKGPKPAALVPESHSSASLLVCISLLFRVMISRRR